MSGISICFSSDEYTWPATVFLIFYLLANKDNKLLFLKHNLVNTVSNDKLKTTLVIKNISWYPSIKFKIKVDSKTSGANLFNHVFSSTSCRSFCRYLDVDYIIAGNMFSASGSLNGNETELSCSLLYKQLRREDAFFFLRSRHYR